MKLVDTADSKAPQAVSALSSSPSTKAVSMAQVFGLRIRNLDGQSCFLAVNLHILSKIPLRPLADRHLPRGDYLLLKVLRDLREGRGIEEGDLAALRTSLNGQFVPKRQHCAVELFHYLIQQLERLGVVAAPVKIVTVVPSRIGGGGTPVGQLVPIKEFSRVVDGARGSSGSSDTTIRVVPRTIVFIVDRGRKGGKDKVRALSRRQARAACVVALFSVTLTHVLSLPSAGSCLGAEVHFPARSALPPLSHRAAHWRYAAERALRCCRLEERAMVPLQRRRCCVPEPAWAGGHGTVSGDVRDLLFNYQRTASKAPGRRGSSFAASPEQAARGGDGGAGGAKATAAPPGL